MSAHPSSPVRVAIACGGTGGHLFPGLAVATQLVRRGCTVTLLISPKEVDQQAVKSATGVEIVTLPAVGLQRGAKLAFLRGFVQSYRTARKLFKANPPHAALAMGGFTSAPPILAAKRSGAQTFLHESNTIPGRANRWLSRVVTGAFTGFPDTAARLHTQRVTTTGTPVRPQFQPRNPAECRRALGLAPEKPVLLVMGGSQGASGINGLMVQELSHLAQAAPDLQCIHLTGSRDEEAVQVAYAASGLKALVHGFFAEMDLALGAATVAISRSGASSLAELAAMRVPAVLVPYPAATDNHQFYNAQAFASVGAARLLEQKRSTPDTLTGMVLELLRNTAAREQMQAALAQWHAPHAAEQIAEAILLAVGVGARPSPGAATAASRAASESSTASVPSGLAAPGDGRAPKVGPLSLPLWTQPGRNA